MAEAKAYKMIPHCTKDTITYEMEELVMCKDCKHGRLYESNCIDCEYMELARDANWFCADGEKRG